MTLGVVPVAAALAALTCGALAAASWRALVRTGNRSLALFVAAFAILGVKNLVKSWVAFADLPDGALVEGAFSLADLLAVVLVAWPIVGGGLRS